MTLLTALRRRLAPLGFADITWVDSTGSTNADLLAAPPRDGVVRLAGQQTAGRGRLGRAWASPAGAQLICSLGLIVEDVDRVSTLPLAVGLGIVDAVPAATLKWPNDVLIDSRKLCGILVEGSQLADGRFHVVAGFGLNAGMSADDLPVPHATSLAVAGIAYEPDELTETVLAAVARRLNQWRTADRRLLDDYRRVCVTIGQHVRIDTPGGMVVGLAEAVADDGSIVVDGAAYCAGDVTHLRPAR